MYKTLTFRQRPIAVLLGLLCAGAPLAHAETQAESLPELEVTAQKDKAPAANGYQTKKTSVSTKTDTDLIDVPQSVTVFSKQLMKDQAVQNLGDIVRYTPGVGAAQGEGNRETFIFRGLATTADFFQDGIRDDTQYYRDLYNIERVEVLKGPNGMIFGRGGAGGLINRVSKEASWDAMHEFGFQYGSYDQTRATLDFNNAINEVAAFRLNAMYEDGNSYRDGVSLRRQGINPTVTLKPTDRTKIVLGAEYFKDDRIADRGIPSYRGRPIHTNDSTFFGSASLSPTYTEVASYNVSVEHAFDNGITLKNRTRYADFDKFYQNVFPGNVTPAGTQVSISAYNNMTERQNLINQTDLNFKWDTGFIKHDTVVGIELGRQRTSNFRETGYFNNTNTTSVLVPVGNPVLNAPLAFRQSDTDANNYTENKTYALYFQDQLKFSEQWSAIAGLRYDRFTTDFTNDRLPASNANHKISVDDNLFSPRAGLIFKPISNLSVYTSYSLSYVPRAGEQLASLTATNKSFDPERYNNIELGVKWDYNPDLSLTAAIYKLERNKIAITDPSDPTRTILADGQESKGLELGINGKLTPAWSVAGGYAYQDAEITKRQGNSNPASVILAGTDVAQVPRHTFSLWNRYDFNEVWGVGLGVISRSDMYAQTPVVGGGTVISSVTLPGYTRVDAAVFAQLDKNLRVQLNIENLLNKDYYLYAHTNNNITPGSPVAARLSVVANF